MAERALGHTRESTETDWLAVRSRRRRRSNRAALRRRRLAWGAAYATTTAALAVGVSGLLARTTTPVVDWVPQVAAAALPYVGPLMAPGATVLGIAAVRSRRPSAAALAVLCAALFVAWASRSPSPPSTADGRLRIMSLNVGHSYGREGAIADYVASVDPDIVLFQEAGPHDPAVGRVLSLDGYGIHVDTTAVGAGRISRQVLVSRVPVRSYESGPLGSLDMHSGVYARAVVDVDGSDVAVYNVHLRPFNPEARWSWKRIVSPAVWAETPANLRAYFAEQAAEVEALAAMIESDPLPVVVGGDFNATPDQWTRTRLSHTLRETTGRWRPGATRPSSLPLANIDGILVGPEWAVAEAGVGRGGLSDHRPVIAAVSLRRPPR